MCLFSLRKDAETSPIVFTRYGAISGKSFKIDNDRYANAFMGIPYAKPPIGSLRFQKPETPNHWEGVRRCTQHAPQAPQKEYFFDKFRINRVRTSEDCLYLNVFAPAWKPKEEKNKGFAVLVFIHGGAFAVHTSAYYGDINICKYLCSKDVIVVTLQYRLGILGFAATGDDSCVPNLGLWDQTLALRWVNEEIAAFGGNPQNITVFGQSAGGASVEYLTLSPHSQRLFCKTISMSGAATCGWALNDPIKIRDALRQKAFDLGWRPPKSKTVKELNMNLMEFLRSKSSRSLGINVKIFGRDKKSTSFYGIDFTPVIDGDFLPESISALRKKAPKKICLTGTTEFEGMLFACFRERGFDRKALESVIEELIPNSDLRKKAVALYLKGGETKKQQKRAFLKLYSDIYINNGVHSFAEGMVKAGHKVYLYEFEYHPRSFGPIGWFFPFIASTHGTDLPYLFGKGIFFPVSRRPIDMVMLDKYTTLFTNFAKYGNPYDEEAQSWKPLSEKSLWQYLNINETTEMKDDFHERRAAFWNCLSLSS